MHPGGGVYNKAKTGKCSHSYYVYCLILHCICTVYTVSTLYINLHFKIKLCVIGIALIKGHRGRGGDKMIISNVYPL